MRSKLFPLSLLAVVVNLALLVGGCGNTTTVTTRVSVPAPPLHLTYIPPTSSITPEGAKPLVPQVALRPTAHLVTINVQGLHLIEGFEGYSRCAYADPFTGTPTAGFGQTKGVFLGFCFSGRAAAEANLKRSVQVEYEWAVHAIGFPFDQKEINGLDSFAYNLGAGIFTGSLRADLRAGQFRAAGAVMLQYDHAGGQVVGGLRTRRILEVDEMLRAEPKPPSRRDLLARQRTLRRVLLHDGCRQRKKEHHKLGEKCTRWFVEGAVIKRELAA